MHLSLPIIQAPMAGGITTPQLVSAVCEAGALGSLGAGYQSPESIQSSISQIKDRTQREFSVNLFIPPEKQDPHDLWVMKNELVALWKKAFDSEAEFAEHSIPSFDEQIEVVLGAHIPIFSFTFGLLPPEYIKKFKAQGTFLIGTATTPEEALQLEKSGVDAIVCQGYEAGGHRGSFTLKDPLYTLSTLLTLTKKKVSVPLIAAGGLMDQASIQSVFDLGASYAQLGTAFLTTEESGAHPLYKKTLLESTRRTCLSNAYTGKWARGIENEMMHSLKDLDIPYYPLQHFLTRAFRSKASEQNNAEWMSLWAGQGYALCKSQTVKQLLDSLNIQF